MHRAALHFATNHLYFALVPPPDFGYGTPLGALSWWVCKRVEGRLPEGGAYPGDYGIYMIVFLKNNISCASHELQYFAKYANTVHEPGQLHVLS